MSADITGPLATPANVAAFLPAAGTQIVGSIPAQAQTVGTAPAGTSDADLILSLNPPVTEQEIYDFTKDNGRPPNSPRELYDWIVSIRSKRGVPGQKTTPAGQFRSSVVADNVFDVGYDLINQYGEERLNPIMDVLLKPIVTPIQQLKSALFDRRTQATTAKVTVKGQKVPAAVSIENAGNQGGGGPVPKKVPKSVTAAPRAVAPRIAPVSTQTTSPLSVIEQITTHLSRIASNSGSTNSNITMLNETMKALLDAFNAANPSKSENNVSNNYQEGGRRRQTKGRRKRRGATRR